MGRGYYNNYYYRPTPKPKDPAIQREKLRKKDPTIQPIILEGKKLAASWWAIAWNKNLESYADYESRIGRGRSYVRQGAVLDLRINPGYVTALVQGTKAKPYEIIINIQPLDPKTWQDIVRKCSRSISNMAELAEGKFPEDLSNLFTDKNGGLFPAPSEIDFGCSCPDWASMCKHVAAVLYGIGARFDEDPTLFFTLRDIDFTELLKKSVEDKMQNMLKNSDQVTPRVIADDDITKLFGV